MPDPAYDSIGARAPGHYGTASAGLTLAEATITAAWNVQGDPARPGFVAGVQQAFGVPLPVAPNTTKRGSGILAFWLGPRSWLLIECAEPGVPAMLAGFNDKRRALDELGGALFDVSASRVAYRVRGNGAPTLLAKGCPLDFDPEVFAAGACAQSLLGHMNALYYAQDATPTFTVMVARSFATDAWRSLCRSATHHGYDVVPPTPLTRFPQAADR